MHDGLLTLLGIGVIVVGFALRANPLLVVIASALVTGWFAGINPLHVLEAFGKAFNDNRYVGIIWLVLPVIGLLEREGLQERARSLIGGLRRATTGKLLLAYMAFRQITIALGLPIGGQAQMVRPLIAPMAEAAAEKQTGALSDKTRFLVRAYAASADNIGAFFGEDIFVAVASVLLIKGFLETNHIIVQPLTVSLWAIPTALLAFLIHGVRLLLLDRALRRERK